MGRFKDEATPQMSGLVSPETEIICSITSENLMTRKIRRTATGVLWALN